ncbi:MAG: segregation/condensation protein A, partial [Sandaracinaceae bacterium]|nr:segregation/condensation protein A [Sandaracinaceae bacterium]
MSSSSSNTPEPLDPSFQIRLPAFEGPLDLLLHLIKKHELEVLDLPIAFVTERYLEYIGVMEKLSLDIASEYLVMAATLAYIKSRMLLPQEAAQEEEEATLEEEIDPRAELIRRLLEYQKYKVAAEHLAGRGVTGRDVFLRGSDAPEATGPAPLASMTLYKLLDAFQGILKRAKTELAFAITTEGVSIQERMRELTDRLRAERDIQFDQLFEGAVGVFDLVITFLAILEMAKRRLVRIYQAEATSAIHLRSTVVDADEAQGSGAPPAVETVEQDAALRETVEVEVPGRVETVSDQAARSLETVETVSDLVARSVETVETVSDQAARSLETVETVSDQAARSLETVETASDQAARSVETVETVSDQAARSVETVETASDQAARSVETVETVSTL